jgi:uncharacterized repeat protein (TIGR03803 family)
MRGQRISIRLKAILLTICTTILFLTNAYAATWKVLHNGDGNSGEQPFAGVIFDTAGNLYGTFSAGGAYGEGTVFELSPAPGGGWTEKVLHDFNNDGKDGTYPVASLTFDAVGNLYGTTNFGGYGGETVFELTPNAGGVWTDTVLHGFSKQGENGAGPFAGLVFDASGNLYGTAYSGGAFGQGTVFEITP